jgi:hypothetical protein
MLISNHLKEGEDGNFLRVFFVDRLPPKFRLSPTAYLSLLFCLVMILKSWCVLFALLEYTKFFRLYFDDVCFQEYSVQFSQALYYKNVTGRIIKAFFLFKLGCVDMNWIMMKA